MRVEFIRDDGAGVYALRDFSSVEAAFEQLRSATGVFIDRYGRSRLYPDHQTMVVRALRGLEQCPAYFVVFLADAAASGTLILVEGD
ncbi:hypothetical protein ACFJGV_03010 [Cnuibacter sp. UC19_7]|uniref:hypothetical protein n=1 Tax=Cnuibacter sp. UC19_7 TaxID=3350166 RepID=UPI00366F6B03